MTTWCCFQKCLTLSSLRNRSLRPCYTLIVLIRLKKSEEHWLKNRMTLHNESFDLDWNIKLSEKKSIRKILAVYTLRLSIEVLVMVSMATLNQSHRRNDPLMWSDMRTDMLIVNHIRWLHSSEFFTLNAVQNFLIVAHQSWVESDDNLRTILAQSWAFTRRIF